MLKLYNTSSRRKGIFRPYNEGRVGIYTCGPTLHNFAHIGLIRRLLVVDVLKKVLRHAGYQVRHIVNLTDIDDKTIAESGRQGVSLEELTGRFATEFFDDMASLRMSPADHYPRATEHVADMVAMTQKLIDAGVAYVMQRSVYFDISKRPGYGKLSGVNISKIRTGATVDLDYYEKDNPRDFTVMRRSDLKELRRRITYATEWGNVRPGWHIECAAMAEKYLGLPFDVHTSGADLIFPHNENENAICESLSSHSMARYWLHTGIVLRDGKKMSRSAGSALTLRDLLSHGYTGSQVRYFLLQFHYRKPVELSLKKLDASCRNLARLNKLIKNLRLVQNNTGPHKDVDDAVATANHDFFAALHDDLNAPRAKAVLFDLLKKVNEHIHSSGFSRCDAQLTLDFLYRADRIFDVLDFSDWKPVGDDINALLAERDEARDAKDYARADAIRKELEALGINIEDTRSGSRVHTKD